MSSEAGPGVPAPLILGSLERTFINRYQGGFPLVEHPFAAVAQDLGTDPRSKSCLMASTCASTAARSRPWIMVKRL